MKRNINFYGFTYWEESTDSIEYWATRYNVYHRKEELNQRITLNHERRKNKNTRRNIPSIS